MILGFCWRQSRCKPVSFDWPSRLGPRNWGQSSSASVWLASAIDAQSTNVVEFNGVLLDDGEVGPSPSYQRNSTDQR
ncbi:MAG: hypothetical protein KatS3mg105_2754 [Gemmatales bacterium]|nr:MAG: hypothetical protein KatS3mg105_2754 [Gemmatales bacterium]